MHLYRKGKKSLQIKAFEVFEDRPNELLILEMDDIWRAYPRITFSVGE